MSEKMYFKWIGVIYELLLIKFARFRVYVHTNADGDDDDERVRPLNNCVSLAQFAPAVI